MDLEFCYEKIYRYCYMKVQHQQLAEDLTQETFLHFLEDYRYEDMGKQLAYLYTIARHLCVDNYRRKRPLPMPEVFELESQEILIKESHEEKMVMNMALAQAMAALPAWDQELIFLRYVNEVPIGQLCRIFGVSRFALYRRFKKDLKTLKDALGKENFYA